MPKRADFPIWMRNRAQRLVARGCSQRVVALIFRSALRRPPGPAPDERPSNVLPFRSPATARRRLPAPALGIDLRHG